MTTGDAWQFQATDQWQRPHPHSCSQSAMTRVIHGTWAEAMEAHSGPAVDVLENAFELEPIQLAGLLVAAPDGGVRVGELLGQVTRGNPIGLG